MPNILINNNFYQGTSQSCILDLVPPTFAGLVDAHVETRGQIRASWAAATEVTSNPVRYEVYVKASTSVGLFDTANIVGITDKLQLDFWQTPDGAFLVNGTTYHVGVRAVDAVGNRDANLISQSMISTGVFVSSDVYKAEGAFVIVQDQLQGTLWVLKNSVLGTGPTLGTASYQVYDKAGLAVPGMGQAGIVADANGQFKITPITSTLSDLHELYMVKVDIIMDSQVRTGYVPLAEPPHQYEIDGAFGLSTSNELEGTFWASADEEILTNPARLGTASYEIRDRLGNLVPSMSETGITPDVNGLFKITPVASSLAADLTFYTVKVTMMVDGVARSEILPIMGKIPSYDCYGLFSINASNQLIGMLHVETDGKVKKGVGLGTASYQVYDAAGVAVPGLTETGIVADANGRFIITPVLATLITDLTHFSVTIKIIADGIERESFHGLSPLGS